MLLSKLKYCIAFTCLILITNKVSIAQNYTLNNKPYFQQNVNYTIDVTLIDTAYLLKGNITIDYTNNSPDTLNNIYFHLWPNAYKNDRTAFNKQLVESGNTNFYFSKQKDKGYIKDLDFKVDGKEVNLSESNGQQDIAIIDLPSALLPKQTIKITTPFTVKIPKIFSRMGHSGKDEFAISQWYPKPAVYDKYGWHPMPYLDEGEFYSEYGNYKVSITIPKNYVVAATGNLITPSEIKWIDDQILDTSELSTKKIDDLVSKKIKTTTEYKTIQFEQNNIHDFAWFANKKFLIEKSNVYNKDKKINTYIFFMPQNYKEWHNQCSSINKTLDFLNSKVGSYPYDNCTAVDGGILAGAGMEYPTITVIGSNQSNYYLKEIIYHEVGHNWFYGILGNNERDFGFLDEGINTFYETKIINSNTNTDKYKMPLHAIQSAIINKDQPVTTTALALHSQNYVDASYSKPEIYFAQLEQYLGTTTFDKCMQNYYSQWQLKHPYPNDLQLIFEQSSGKNLDWFFNGLLTTTNKIDFKIKSVKTIDNKIEATIKNKTKTTAPISVDLFNYDTLKQSIILEPFKDFAVAKFTNTAFTKIVLDDANKVMDVNIKNNYYYKNNLFKKTKLHLSFKEDYNFSNKYELGILPTAGFNINDGFLLGVAWHNKNPYQQHFKFYGMPMYGFTSKQFGGMAAIGGYIYSQNFIRKTSIELYASKFAYENSNVNITNRLFTNYIRLNPTIRFEFKNNQPSKNIYNILSYNHFLIWKNSFKYIQSPSDSLYRPTVGGYKNYFISKLSFYHSNARTMNPYFYNFSAEGNQLYAKLTAQAKIKMNYNMPNKALQIRVFAGKFFNFASYKYDAYDYIFAGTHTAANDYTLSNYYIGRSSFDNILTQQIVEQEGGMKLTSPKLSSPIGLSDNYLFATNIKTDIPLKLPFTARPFVDFIAYQNQPTLTETSIQSSFDAGIQLAFFKEKFLINIPFLMSKDYKDYFNTTFSKQEKWKNIITFSVLVNNFSLDFLPSRY